MKLKNRFFVDIFLNHQKDRLNKCFVDLRTKNLLNESEELQKELQEKLRKLLSSFNIRWTALNRKQDYFLKKLPGYKTNSTSTSEKLQMKIEKSILREDQKYHLANPYQTQSGQRSRTTVILSTMMSSLDFTVPSCQQSARETK
jgi:hypothetical protein